MALGKHQHPQPHPTNTQTSPETEAYEKLVAVFPQPTATDVFKSLLDSGGDISERVDEFIENYHDGMETHQTTNWDVEQPTRNNT